MTKAMNTEAVALLRLIADHLGAIRRAVERPPASFDRQGELLAALQDYFGAGAPFTTQGVLTIADEDPRSPIASALARVIDLAAPGRAVALGKLLSSIDALERSRRAGVLLYRLGVEE
jgi:hypothetical protein